MTVLQNRLFLSEHYNISQSYRNATGIFSADSGNDSGLFSLTEYRMDACFCYVQKGLTDIKIYISTELVILFGLYFALLSVLIYRGAVKI